MAPPVAIVGAGIGGLTAALLLARGGRAVTLFERRSAPAEEGAGIQLSPNASRILLAAGLGPALKRAAFEPDALRIGRFEREGVLATLSLGDLAERHGAPYWCLRRADLHAALLAAVAAEPGVALRPGVKVSAVSPHAGGARLRLEGGEEIEAGLAVVADGLWSSLSGVSRAAPRFTGFEAWRAVLPRASVPVGTDLAGVGLRLGHGRHLVHYPVAGGNALNLVLVLAAARAREGWTGEGDFARLGPALREASSPMAALLRAVESWRVWSLHDRTPAAMADGRVALLGDAAHPVLPFLAQGAALAIEDAAALAAGLQDGGADAALARYDAMRRPRAVRVRRAAWRNGEIYHLTPPLAAARDLALRLAPGAALGRGYDWLYGWRADALG